MSFSSGLQFRVIDGQEKDRIIQLNEKELTLGRALQGQRPGRGEVLFRESSVSRLHASLSWKKFKGGFQLVNKSRTNPTLVNGEPTESILLVSGDRVQMGYLILVLEASSGGRQFASKNIGGDGRNYPSTTGPGLDALNRNQPQPERESMASSELPESATSARRRLDEALQVAPPRPEDERKKRRDKPVFAWKPPEER